MINPFLFGIGPVLLVLLVACCALFGMPVYFWLADRRRRGERVGGWGLFGVCLGGILGVVALLLFLFVRRD